MTRKKKPSKSPANGRAIKNRKKSVNKASSFSLHHLQFLLILIVLGLIVGYFLQDKFIPVTPKAIGQNKVIVIKKSTSFADIARRFDVAYTILRKKNPMLQNENLPPNTTVFIPGKIILPKVRQGIVIKLSSFRLFYFMDNHKIVTFPISIGKLNHDTPVGQFKIISKIKDPIWHPSEAIRQARAEQGIETLDQYPAGPNNPLGQYALRLSNWNYLIHGTNTPNSIGKKASSGCIRMYPEDIKCLFALVPVDTVVTIEY